jgi:hypothetical protein
VIQLLMVATVIAFPGLVTSHVSKAATVQGSGLEELQRQLGAPSESPAPQGQGDIGSEVERALRGK